VVHFFMLQILPIYDFPIIKPKDDIAEIILSLLNKNVTVKDREGLKQLRNPSLEVGDIIVICHTIVSKAENKIVSLKNIKPSQFAIKIAKKHPHHPDPRKIEVILRDCKRIVRHEHVLITETKHGLFCANNAIDMSNVDGGNSVICLPDNPDISAQKIKEKIESSLNIKPIGVIINDSHGRPWRRGVVGVAIGCAGLPYLINKNGKKDLFGYTLKSTEISIADQIASAAELVMGESDEGIPVVIVRGLKDLILKYKDSKEYTSLQSILRSKEEDLFR